MKDLLKPHQIEGLKEVGRWLLMFVVSWIATEVLRQVEVLPTVYDLHVYLFVFSIPVRTTVSLLLTSLLRFIDKAQHEAGKEKGDKTKGFIPF